MFFKALCRRPNLVFLFTNVFLCLACSTHPTVLKTPTPPPTAPRDVRPTLEHAAQANRRLRITVLTAKLSQYETDLQPEPVLKLYVNGARSALKTKLPQISQRKITLTDATLLHSVYILPDKKKLHVFASHWPLAERKPNAHAAALRALNAAVKKIPATELRMAMGDFGVSRLFDEEQNWIERFLQPDWLVAQRLGCLPQAPCQGTMIGTDGRDSFQEMILVDKSLFDGNNGWRIVRQVVVDRPSAPAIGQHWPLSVFIEPL